MKTFLAACLACATFASANASPKDHTVVGQWLVMNNDRSGGVILSFADDHTVRMLFPLSEAQLAQIPTMPAEKQASLKNNMFTSPEGKQYLETSGTWTAQGASAIDMSLNLPNGSVSTDKNLALRFTDPDKLTLAAEGKPATDLVYKGTPLPPKKKK